MKKVNPLVFEVRNDAYGKNPDFAITCAQITENAIASKKHKDWDSLDLFVQLAMAQNVEKLTSTKWDDVHTKIRRDYAIKRPRTKNNSVYKAYYGRLDTQHRAEVAEIVNKLEAGEYSNIPNMIKPVFDEFSSNYVFRYDCKGGNTLTLTTLINTCDGPFYSTSQDDIEVSRAELEYLYKRATTKSLSQKDKMESAADFYYLLSHVHQLVRGSATHARICLQVISEIAGLDLQPAKPNVDINVQALFTPREVFKQSFCSGEYFEKSPNEGKWVNQTKNGISDNTKVR